MSSKVSPEGGPPNLGFLTVVQSERMGWTGGLLVLDPVGHPVEFQCTLPIRPTRTHEILFGPTLRSHLVGDVISKALLQKCRSRFALLCCDQRETLACELASDCPVAFVLPASEDEFSRDAPEGFQSLRLADKDLWVAIERVQEARVVAEQLRSFPDPLEPFERIQEAIQEAHSQLARQQDQAA